MYSQLVKELIHMAKENGATQKTIDDLLDRPLSFQERTEGSRATIYRDFVEGAFNLGEMIRIKRKHDDYSISNKMFDFSSNTINRLMQDGYNDAIESNKSRFGMEILKGAGIQENFEFSSPTQQMKPIFPTLFAF